jgi:hypothetical protein
MHGQQNMKYELGLFHLLKLLLELVYINVFQKSEFCSMRQTDTK